MSIGLDISQPLAASRRSASPSASFGYSATIVLPSQNKSRSHVSIRRYGPIVPPTSYLTPDRLSAELPPNRRLTAGVLELIAPRKTPPAEPHHEPPTSLCSPAPLILLLSSALLASAYSRETAAARTTVLDLEREYQADQSSLHEAFGSAGLGGLSRSAAAAGRGVAGTPGEVRFRVARSPREGRVPAAAERSAGPARRNGPGEEAAGRDRAAGAVPHDDPRIGNGPPAVGRFGLPGGGHQGSPNWPMPSSKFASTCPSRAASRFPRRLPSARPGPCTSCRKC